MAGSGYGLTGMRERAELLGGELVASRPAPVSASSCGCRREPGAPSPRAEPDRFGSCSPMTSDSSARASASCSRLLDGIELLASAADGEEALTLVERHRPDVVLMDLRMPRLDGIEATRRLRQRHPDVRVIALTTYADDESVLGALRAGARGYLTKDASSDDIRSAILTVAGGEAALDPAVQHHVVAALSDGDARCGRGGRHLPARRADRARGARCSP